VLKGRQRDFSQTCTSHLYYFGRVSCYSHTDENIRGVMTSFQRRDDHRICTESITNTPMSTVLYLEIKFAGPVIIQFSKKFDRNVLQISGSLLDIHSLRMDLWPTRLSSIRIFKCERITGFYSGHFAREDQIIRNLCSTRSPLSMASPSMIPWT
jgi:hypothetical protein